ncbi:hypothetical protein [Nocardioides sp.]|uniref:hypothetical protein n=1 Tax=Nocardioides sp. TaxID=35761 RepID=UPI003D14385D
MTENQNPVPSDAPLVPPSYVPAPAPAPKTSLRHRVLSLPAVAGVAVASLILGGAGGAVLGAVSDGSSQGDFRGGPGGQGGTGQFPGGQPPNANTQQQGQQPALPTDQDDD